MTADFAIYNNTHSSGNGRREILKKLAKGVIKKSVEQENNLRQIFQADEYFTKEYIPAETYIYSISARACMNDKLKVSLDFLNNQAAIKNLPNKEVKGVESVENVLLQLDLDDSNNIFAA